MTQGKEDSKRGDDSSDHDKRCHFRKRLSLLSSPLLLSSFP